MLHCRIVTRYPNRRLYDLASKRYVTVADVRALVLKGVDFQVRDAVTRKDVTRLVLLQVLVDLERRGRPALSREALLRAIRSRPRPGR